MKFVNYKEIKLTVECIAFIISVVHNMSTSVGSKHKNEHFYV